MVSVGLKLKSRLIGMLLFGSEQMFRRPKGEQGVLNEKIFISAIFFPITESLRTTLYFVLRRNCWKVEKQNYCYPSDSRTCRPGEMLMGRLSDSSYQQVMGHHGLAETDDNILVRFAHRLCRKNDGKTGADGSFVGIAFSFREIGQEITAGQRYGSVRSIEWIKRINLSFPSTTRKQFETLP